jgi:multidrug efflux pump subunit AcrA (membrane-fusion protein)
VPRREPEPPSRWRIPALLALIGLLAGGLYLLRRAGEPIKTGGVAPAPAVRVAQGPVERVLRLSGQTSARRFASIMVPTFRGPDSGRELTLLNLAKAGSFVKKGELIAELDGQNLKDHIDDVTDLVQQADNDILKKKAEQEVEWETLQQSLRVARSDSEKARLDLRTAEVKTPIERELLQLNDEEAAAAYKQQQADLADKKIADRAEIRILEITAQRQRIHLTNHSNDLKRFTIHAPMDGLVVMLETRHGNDRQQFQLGDQVHPGEPFMKIVDTSSMQVEALVSQADSSELRIGQSASIGLDAFPGLQFRGRIYSMGAMAVKGVWDTYYIRNVPVRIHIDGSDPRLIPDLSAWANFSLAQQTDLPGAGRGAGI